MPGVTYQLGTTEKAENHETHRVDSGGVIFYTERGHLFAPTNESIPSQATTILNAIRSMRVIAVVNNSNLFNLHTKCLFDMINTLSGEEIAQNLRVIDKVLPVGGPMWVNKRNGSVNLSWVTFDKTRGGYGYVSEVKVLTKAGSFGGSEWESYTKTSEVSAEV